MFATVHYTIYENKAFIEKKGSFHERNSGRGRECTG